MCNGHLIKEAGGQAATSGIVNNPECYRAMRIFYLLLVWMLSSAVSADLVLGVHPYLEPGNLKKRFQPLAEYLSSELETTVEVRVAQDYQSHIEAIGNDEIDIAYLGPSIYVKVTDDYGEKPILARIENAGQSTFNGYIVIRADSNLQQLSDLKGKFFAFGDKNSTMSSLVPQAMLLEQGITLDKLSGYQFYKGHKNVALAVLAGDADAGAVKEEVFHNLRNKGLKALARSPDISEHLFITRSNMDISMIHRIRHLLLRLRSPEEVKSLLQPIKPGLTGMTPASDIDYDNLRKLMKLLK
jgi:phosphonate transport system substrate-binding protein